MTVKPPSNLASLDRVLRRLRREKRLDVDAEAAATLCRTLASEVDAACAPGSDVPTYARGRIVGPYLQALAQLRNHVRLPEPPPDPWTTLAAELDASHRRGIKTAEEGRARRYAQKHHREEYAGDDPDEDEEVAIRVAVEALEVIDPESQDDYWRSLKAEYWEGVEADRRRPR
jgi:hypothetical protein